MPLASPKYPFNTKYVDGAPRDAGVYALFDGAEVIFLGVAEEGLRARLMAHLSGKVEPAQATHYGWEIHVHPRLRYGQLIEEFIRESRVPRFNEADSR